MSGGPRNTIPSHGSGSLLELGNTWGVLTRVRARPTARRQPAHGHGETMMHSTKVWSAAILVAVISYGVYPSQAETRKSTPQEIEAAKEKYKVPVCNTDKKIGPDSYKPFGEGRVVDGVHLKHLYDAQCTYYCGVVMATAFCRDKDTANNGNHCRWTVMTSKGHMDDLMPELSKNKALAVACKSVLDLYMDHVH